MNKIGTAKEKAVCGAAGDLEWKNANNLPANLDPSNDPTLVLLFHDEIKSRIDAVVICRKADFYPSEVGSWLKQAFGSYRANACGIHEKNNLFIMTEEKFKELIALQADEGFGDHELARRLQKLADNENGVMLLIDFIKKGGRHDW